MLTGTAILKPSDRCLYTTILRTPPNLRSFGCPRYSRSSRHELPPLECSAPLVQPSPPTRSLPYSFCRIPRLSGAPPRASVYLWMDKRQPECVALNVQSHTGVPAWQLGLIQILFDEDSGVARASGPPYRCRANPMWSLQPNACHYSQRGLLVALISGTPV